jgi:hypothetical protein
MGLSTPEIFGKKFMITSLSPLTNLGEFLHKEIKTL